MGLEVVAIRTTERTASPPEEGLPKSASGARSIWAPRRLASRWWRLSSTHSETSPPGLNPAPANLEVAIDSSPPRPNLSSAGWGPGVALSQGQYISFPSIETATSPEAIAAICLASRSGQSLTTPQTKGRGRPSSCVPEAAWLSSAPALSLFSL